MENENKPHPFARTLGAGPYRFVGMFEINLEAGRRGLPYYDPSRVHKNFKEGCGTCAHCGKAILVICQIQIGNGDVYGVGSDCVAKVDMPMQVVSAIKKEKNARAAKQRADRKEKAHAEKVATAKELYAYDTWQATAKTKPHPNAHFAQQGRTLFDYLEWCNTHHNWGAIVTTISELLGIKKAGV